MANGRNDHMTMFIPHLWLAVFIFKAKLRSFTLAPIKGQNYFSLLPSMYPFFRENITRISRLPFAVTSLMFSSLQSLSSNLCVSALIFSCLLPPPPPTPTHIQLRLRIKARLFHSRPQSRVPFGQCHGTKALAGTNLKSANRGLPVVLRRLGADPKIMADQML